MYLVDKKNISLAEVGEKCGKVALLFNCRSRGHAEIHAEFGGDYAGQRCFSETRRSVKQHMIKIIPSQLHRVNIYFENLLCLLLSDILVHIERAKAHLVFVILGCRIRGYYSVFKIEIVHM